MALKNVSAARIRIGILFVLIWWLPIWLLEPVIYRALDALGIASSNNHTAVIVGIVTIQTAIGLAGIIIGGKQIISLVKQTPKKKVLPVLWKTVIHGQPKELDPKNKAT